MNGKGDKPLVGVVGHGFVGKAVERSMLPEVERFLVDPNYSTTIDQLIEQSHYRQRRQNIAEFNASQSYLRRGLALTPVKFGISFTSTMLNQAGALVHVYKDGTVQLNHGGTEMGQGL